MIAKLMKNILEELQNFGYFGNDRFKNYLKYLEYFKRPEYFKFVKYSIFCYQLIDEFLLTGIMIYAQVPTFN